MDVSALGPDDVGKGGDSGGKRLLNGERSGGGDAIGKADRGTLAVIAASADQLPLAGGAAASMTIPVP